MTVYSETCINWSCSEAETLLRRIDTFDPVCLLYASLSRISEAETVKRTLVQTENFFQPSNKKVICLTRTQIKALGISEKLRINFDVFLSFLKKKSIFYTLKEQFLFISFRILNIVSNNFCRFNRLVYAPPFC